MSGKLQTLLRLSADNLIAVAILADDGELMQMIDSGHNYQEISIYVKENY